MSRKLTIILFLLSITSWALLKQESLLVPAPIQACTWVVTSCGAGCADNKDLYNCSQTVQIQAVVSSESNVDSNAKAQYVAPPTVKQYVPPPPPASAQASAAYDPTKIVSTAAVETIKNTPGYSVNPNTTTIDATGKGGNVEEAIGQTATKVKETPPVIKADTSLSISVVNPKGKGEGENCKSGNDCLSGSCEKKLAVSDLDPTTGERIKIFRSFCTAPSMTRTCWYRTQISDEWTCQSTTRESLTRCSDIGMLSTKVGCEAVNNVLFGQTKCWQIINNSCQETTLNGTCYSNNAFTAPGLCEVKLLEIQQNRQESAQRQEQIESQRAVEEHRMVEAILQNEAQKAVQRERDNEQAASDAKRLDTYATSQQTYTDNLQNRTKTCYDKANNCQSASKVLRKTTDTCESVGSYTHQKQCQNPGISGPEEQEIFTKKCYEQSPDCREITRVFNSPTATCEEDGLFSSPDQCETPGSVGYSECSEAPDGQKQTLDISGSISQVCLDPDGCYCAPGNKNIVCSEKCTSYISEVSDFGDQGVVSKVTQKCSGDQFGECEEGEVCTLQSKPGEGTIYFCKGEEIEPTEELVSRQDKPIDQTTKKSAASSITGLLKGLINKSKTETEKIISNIFQLEQSLEACPSSRLLFPSIQGGVACTDSDNKVQFYCYKGDIAHMADGTIHCLYNPNGSIHNYVAPLETPKVAPVEPSVPPDEFGGVGEVTALKCSGDQFGECEDDRQCKGSHTPDGDITYSCQKSETDLTLESLISCSPGYFSTNWVRRGKACKYLDNLSNQRLGFYCEEGLIFVDDNNKKTCSTPSQINESTEDWAINPNTFSRICFEKTSQGCSELPIRFPDENNICESNGYYTLKRTCKDAFKSEPKEQVANSCVGIGIGKCDGQGNWCFFNGNVVVNSSCQGRPANSEPQLNSTEITEDELEKLQSDFYKKRGKLLDKYFNELDKCSEEIVCSIEGISRAINKIESFDSKYLSDCEENPHLEICPFLYQIIDSQNNEMLLFQEGDEIGEDQFTIDSNVTVNQEIITVNVEEECSSTTCLCFGQPIAESDICKQPLVYWEDGKYYLRLCSGDLLKCDYYDVSNTNPQEILRQYLLSNPDKIYLDGIDARDLLGELGVTADEARLLISEGTFSQIYSNEDLDDLLDLTLSQPSDQIVDYLLNQDLSLSEAERARVRSSFQLGFDLNYGDLNPAADQPCNSAFCQFINGLPFSPERIALSARMMQYDSSAPVVATSLFHLIGVTDIVTYTNRSFYQTGMAAEEAEYYRTHTSARWGDAIFGGIGIMSYAAPTAKAIQPVLGPVLRGVGSRVIVQLDDLVRSGGIRITSSRISLPGVFQRFNKPKELFDNPNLLRPATRTLVADASNMPRPGLLGDQSLGKYFISQTQARKVFIEGVRDGRYIDYPEFRDWMDEIHVAGAGYRANANPGRVRFGNQPIHSKRVSESENIERLSKVLFDDHEFTGPLYSASSDDVIKVRLANIPDDAQPFNIGAMHYYPAGDDLDIYFKEMHRTFNEFMTLPAGTDKEVVVKAVAEYYQYAINARPYYQVNQSIFMNQVNGMLEAHGISGVEHGLLDHAAHRLQPEQFQQFFRDYVSVELK